MIISTGMKTDIPAFYSKWFLNRIKEGFVYVRNPYSEHQVTKYLLNSSVVDCVCFCTKNPIPMLDHVEIELKPFKQFWFVTITPYGKDIEPNVPSKTKIIEAFKSLSTKLGKNAVGWRYDPILFSKEWNYEKHVQEFEKIAKQLKGYTKICAVSVIDLYEKIKRNAPGIFPPSKEEQLKLFKNFVKIAKENDMIIKGCYEGQFLEEVGVDYSGCQTKEIIEKAIGFKLNIKATKNVRGNCNCLLGQDIGTYNSCGHLCKYCYANADQQIVLKNMKNHDPNSPFLIGQLQNDDKITEANQKSYVSRQLSFW